MAISNMDYPMSFLSPSLKQLLVDKRLTYINHSCPNNFVSQYLTLHWDSISHLFEELLSGCSSYTSTTQMYASTCQNMWPFLTECGFRLRECKSPPILLWQWTGCDDDIQLCFTELNCIENLVTPFKVSLILSSIFEHAIGNVYQLTDKAVPFLLRDLLSSNELIPIFGQIPMLMAQVLLGTPLAFNLRNVCWHGFPAPPEVHRDVAAALLILITSFGKQLEESGVISFPRRPKLGLDAWNPILPSLKDANFPKLIGYLGEVRTFIDLCDLIPNSHKLYWTSSLEYLSTGQYAESVVLILPAFEHTLRCIFCTVNCCHSRVLVAEQHTLYTTLNEMLARSFKTSEGKEEANRLPSLLGNNVMEMLMDLFETYAGLRVRDKLSHGEYELKHIPWEVANHIFCVALVVLLKVQASATTEPGLLINDLRIAEANYSAKFHSVCLLRNQVKTIKEKVKNFDQYLNPSKVNFNSVSSEILKLESNLMDFSSQVINSSDTDLSRKTDFCLTVSVSTLYRTKSDLSVIATLRKITASLEQTCDNCQHALDSRLHLLNQHTLRSRQRVSFLQMLEYIASLQTVLRCATFLVLLQLLALPEILGKFLKTVQKYAENLASLTGPKKNRWVDMREKTTEFCCECSSVLNVSCSSQAD